MSSSVKSLAREIAVMALVFFGIQAVFYAFDSPLEWRSQVLAFSVLVGMKTVAWAVDRKRER